MKLTRTPSMRSGEPVANLRKIIDRNRTSRVGGVYAVCSAHPWVLEAAARQAIADGSVLHVESTSSQVNQEGGYTGQTPAKFAEYIHSLAEKAGLSSRCLLLGADHLGPYPWRKLPSEKAMNKACELVRNCVRAGYSKLHLDASMACADDKEPLSDHEVAARAAVLCEVAEETTRESGAYPPVYVVGTEVPTPGGQDTAEGAPAVTPTRQVSRGLATFQKAFEKRGLSDAWERVIGLVVQPGVEFGDHTVFNYDHSKARRLSAALPKRPRLVYEGHSTDYQSAAALGQLVGDHFAILKVGPWLTFAFRETVFALGAIERELLAGKKGVATSHIRQALEAAMLRNPGYWRPYYGDAKDEQRLARAFSYSDRCRYYWPVAGVQKEVARLLKNLSKVAIPLTLISQYLPLAYDAVRADCLAAQPRPLILHHIQRVLRSYSAACSTE